MRHFYIFLVAILFTSFGFGQVFITEIADPDNSAGSRYVELYNAGGSPVDLSTWALRRWTNDNATPQGDVSLSGTIASGDFIIYAANSSTFSSTFSGFSGTVIQLGAGGPADSNGDDNIALVDNTGTIVDIFGVPGEDGSNTCHEFEDGRAERATGVTSGNATWDESEWNVWADTTVGGCTNHTNSAQSAPSDFDPGAWIGAISGPTVGFDSSSSTENETNSTFNVDIPVTLSNYSADVDLSVTVNGSSTAEAGDYTLNTTTLSFTGDGTQNISLDINPDADSDDETIILDIVETTSTGITITSGQHTITVIDNDLPSASIPYNEDFSDCGTQDWTVATVGTELEWTCGSGYFEANAFGSSGAADDYLISPSFDMDAQTGEILSFNSSTSFADVTSPQIELLYTTNYTGEPSTTTWVDTLSPTWPGNDSNGNSGNIDVSGISGTAVHFAFRYTSTGTGGGTTEVWRIEDFDITTASTPSITLSETLLSGFDYADGSGPSAEQTFTAEGNSLTDDITITAPADFEVSTTSGSGFGSSVTLTETGGTVATTTIYVRLASGLSVNTYSGTLSATSTGAVQQDISLSGEVTFVSCAGTSTTFPFSGVSGSTNLEHDSGSNPPGLSGEDCGDNYLIYYDSTPSTDGSGNYIRSNAVDGLIESADWGGEGKFETFAIDVSGETSIDIETFGSTVGSGFNAGSEQFQWWYKLDGGAEINLGSAFINPYTGSLAIGPTTIDVTGINAIIVGFTFDMNGGSDGFEDVDVTVTTTPTVFTFNGSWSPSDPNTNATANDNIIIESGDAVINSNVTCSTVTVDPGTSLTVNSGVTLDATNGTTLESTSIAYSSLILDGSISGPVTYNRYVNVVGTGATGTGGNDLISLPLFPSGGLTFDTFLTQGSPANSTKLASQTTVATTYAFGPYNNNSPVPAYENYDSNSTDALVVAKGYRAATTTGETLTFSGDALQADQTIGLTNPVAGGSQWNLIGNPFASYLDAQEWLSANGAILDPSAVAIYGYNSGTYSGSGDTVGNFTIINGSSNTALNVAPGQAFFVAAGPGNISGDAGTVIFAGNTLGFPDDMRTTTGTDDFIEGRNSANYHLKIKLDGTTSATTSFYFNDNSTRGLDPGFDAATLDAFTSEHLLYSHLVEDNTGRSMAINSLAIEDMSDVTIPLGVNSDQGEEITFSIDTSTIPDGINVYLDDNVANMSTLLNSGNYTLTPTTDLSGTGRFYLRIVDSSLSVPNALMGQLKIYTNNTEKAIVISGELPEASVAHVYDLQGRQVLQRGLNTTMRTQSINVGHLSTGLYIVKVGNGSQQKSQKVILR